MTTQPTKQMNKKRSLLSACGFLMIAIFGLNFPASAQSEFKAPVIEPAPTSAIFSRYGDEKISMQTGAVNIPISLLDIKAQGIDVPLSLAYHTSGISALDTPYPVGYGWIFSPGFRISRNVIGRADDRYPFKQLNGSEDYDELKRGIITDGYDYHLINESELYDSQKDIFTLLLPSGSYNFFINRVGNTYEAISIGNKLKIESIIPSGSISSNIAMITGFKVTDEQGIVYIFAGEDDIINSNFVETEDYQWVTTWALKEIRLLNNEKIYFTWQKTNTNTYAARTNAAVEVIDYKDFDCNYPMYEVNDMGGTIDHLSASGKNALMLTKIEYPSGVVDLAYKSTTDPFLQSILVKNKNNEVIKDIDFTFGSTGLQMDQTLLQSLTINDETYGFQYNNYRFDKGTTALDYWGFYNGKTTNTNLVPHMTLKLRSDVTNGQYYLLPDVDIQVGYADRSPSTAHMQAFMLTKITYPTGGYSEYEYEPHEFPGQYVQSTGLFTQDPDSLAMGGGLRVKEIRTYGSSTATPIIKTYKYGHDEDGLANISVAPTLDTFIEEFLYQIEDFANSCDPPPQVWPSRRVMRINSLSNYNKFLINKNPIWYKEVTEYVNGESKTSYAYELDETYQISWQLTSKVVKAPYAFRYDNLFNNGPRSVKTTIFKKVGTGYEKVKEIANEYEVIDNNGNDIHSAIIDRKAIYSSVQYPGPDLYPDTFYNNGSAPPLAFRANFLALPYSITVQYSRLKKTITTDFDGNNALSNFQQYYYYEPYLIKTVSGSSVSGKNLTTEYKYAFNFTDQVYQDMVTKNMVASVIEATSFRDTIPIKRVKTNFTDSSAITTGLILPASIETTNLPDTNRTTEVAFEKYDSKGNILQKSFLNGTKVSYVWSYGSTYPVAEIINADYATVVTALGGQTAVDTFAAASQSDSTIQSFLAPLRTDLSLKNALVNTYTYRPLVGITSQVDAKGMAIYYEYDDNYRLRNIRDQNGNITKSYCYNYAGQLTDCNGFTEEIPEPSGLVETSTGYATITNDLCNMGGEGVPPHLILSVYGSTGLGAPLMEGQPTPVYYTDSSGTTLAPNGYYTVYEYDLSKGYFIYELQNGLVVNSFWCSDY